MFPIYFNIIKYKQEEGILNKLFLANNYSEYKFGGINKTTKILIQAFTSYDTYKDEIPT